MESKKKSKTTKKPHVYTAATETVSLKKCRQLLGNFVTVRNIDNKAGDDVLKNQFVITFEHGEMFKSYDSVIGVRIAGKGGFTALSWKHDHHGSSKTTSDACATWYGVGQDGRNRDIASGVCKSLLLLGEPEPDELFEFAGE